MSAYEMRLRLKFAGFKSKFLYIIHKRLVNLFYVSYYISNILFYIGNDA